MADDEVSDRGADDEDVLAAIGRALRDQQRTIAVRLPAVVAERARLAWNRDDGSEPPADETPTGKHLRRRAADLALIGLAIEEGGVNDQGEVMVNLDVFQVASALQTAAELEVRRYVAGDDG